VVANGAYKQENETLRKELEECKLELERLRRAVEEVLGAKAAAGSEWISFAFRCKVHQLSFLTSLLFLLVSSSFTASRLEQSILAFSRHLSALIGYLGSGALQWWPSLFSRIFQVGSRQVRSERMQVSMACFAHSQRALTI
jgi:hypothetical protein